MEIVVESSSITEIPSVLPFFCNMVPCCFFHILFSLVLWESDWFCSASFAASLDKSMWRKGNRWTLYSSLWPIWRSKRKTNSWHVFIVWLNAPHSGGAPYSRSRWRSFTNGNGTDSSSSRLYTEYNVQRFPFLHIDSLHFLWCLICGSNH
jgi:hypothetical protein